MQRTPTGPAGRAMTTPTSMPFSKKPSSIPAPPPATAGSLRDGTMLRNPKRPRFLQATIPAKAGRRPGPICRPLLRPMGGSRPSPGWNRRGRHRLHRCPMGPYLRSYTPPESRYAGTRRLAARWMMSDPATGDAYQFEFDSLDGEKLPLAAWRGRPVLVVNTASFCGYTPQYRDLEALWRRYSARGLVVLGVPSNDFGEQEPGSAADIKKFCETNYQVD